MRLNRVDGERLRRSESVAGGNGDPPRVPMSDAIQHEHQPRERTFAEVFPWRNIRRAMLLVATIVAIVAIKRSAAPFLTRLTQILAPQQQAVRPARPPASPAPAAAGI